MEHKKRVTVLVIIALILAITAIALNVTGSEVSTTKNTNQAQLTGAVVGIQIEPPQIEDKLVEQSQQS